MAYIAFQGRIRTFGQRRRAPAMTTERAESQRVRLLIVDDQPLVRRGLALIMSMEPDMEVVGEAGDGIEAVEQAKRLRPDVVLMDLHMPRKGGVGATRELTALLPQTRVMVLTTIENEQSVFDAVRAGDLLDGFVEEEVWLAREQKRAPRSRADLASLIDRSVYEEASARR